jgi:hypothetical protein
LLGHSSFFARSDPPDGSVRRNGNPIAYRFSGKTGHNDTAVTQQDSRAGHFAGAKTHQIARFPHPIDVLLVRHLVKIENAAHIIRIDNVSVAQINKFHVAFLLSHKVIFLLCLHVRKHNKKQINEYIVRM